MTVKPDNWSVVIAGAWNLAILTPDGIRSKLLELDPTATIEIEVALDKPGVFRVINSGVVISPTRNLLEIKPVNHVYESLAEACKIGKRALQALPETPYVAAGINFRFMFDDYPDGLRDLLSLELDNVFSDNNFTIIRSMTQRTLQLQQGVLNVAIDELENHPGYILFNFHLDSKDPNLLGVWLDRKEEFYRTANKILGLLQTN